MPPVTPVTVYDPVAPAQLAGLAVPAIAVGPGTFVITNGFVNTHPLASLTVTE